MSVSVCESLCECHLSVRKNIARLCTGTRASVQEDVCVWIGVCD